ncbi:uncharacterized protein LOC113235793 [Hyposmocoma kahamanoa]|uniref:uncharacterized protein LOC113235793 n=1 Tax=Hyposmocoma kahamanoa TaxID=1477025 RepID=UPI000E6D6ECC|nr:uncharacterized protein LOC113235793 [Hyposmocoma kahamanoa]
MALGSEVNDNSPKNAPQKVKKTHSNTNLKVTSGSDIINKAEKLDKQGKMKKDGSVKVVGCSNGHVSTPNGRADDEGGGGSGSLVASPRVSYAAAARKAASPQNIVPPPFPLNTGASIALLSTSCVVPVKIAFIAITFLS